MTITNGIYKETTLLNVKCRSLIPRKPGFESCCRQNFFDFFFLILFNHGLSTTLNTFLWFIIIFFADSLANVLQICLAMFSLQLDTVLRSARVKMRSRMEHPVAIRNWSGNREVQLKFQVAGTNIYSKHSVQ